MENNSSGSRTLIGMSIVPAGLLPFLLWPLASPRQIPWSFPMYVNTHRYALFPLRVYSHTLIPINLLLVGAERERSWRVLSRTEEPVMVGKTFACISWKPRPTDRARPGLFLTLSRCGLPLVLLSNYPSLSESMCQSNSSESENRAWARARAGRAVARSSPF